MMAWMTNSMNRIHPGAFLSEMLEEMGISQAAFSRRIGVIRHLRYWAAGRGYQTLINATLRESMHGAAIAEILRRVIREKAARG